MKKAQKRAKPGPKPKLKIKVVTGNEKVNSKEYFSAEEMKKRRAQNKARRERVSNLITAQKALEKALDEKALMDFDSRVPLGNVHNLVKLFLEAEQKEGFKSLEVVGAKNEAVNIENHLEHFIAKRTRANEAQAFVDSIRHGIEAELEKVSEDDDSYKEGRSLMHRYRVIVDGGEYTLGGMVKRGRPSKKKTGETRTAVVFPVNSIGYDLISEVTSMPIAGIIRGFSTDKKGRAVLTFDTTYELPV